MYQRFFASQLGGGGNAVANSQKIPVLFDKSPNYLLESHMVPTRLACAMAEREVKIIVILRHPVNRAFSQYQHQMRNAEKYRRESFAHMVEHDLGNLQEAGVVVPSHHAATPINDEEYRSWVHYRKLKGTAAIGRGLYVVQLRQWLAVLQVQLGKTVAQLLKDNVLILESEAMLQDRQAYFNVVLDFVGLPPFELPEQDNGIQ